MSSDLSRAPEVEVGGEKYHLVEAEDGRPGFCGIDGKAGTLVLTSLGQKVIESIKTGDTVRIYNHLAHTADWSVVKATFHKTAKRLVSLYAAGTLLCQATPEHRFWSHSRQIYVEAAQLQVGEQLLNSQGKTVLLEKVWSKDTLADVYNFEVAGQHNYFVGQSQVLVHNDCGDGSELPKRTISWSTVKNNIANRLKNKKDWILKYTDAEIESIVKHGESLNLPEQEIEDIIINGCRPDKDFDANSLMAQMSFWDQVKKRGYPNIFQSLQEYEQFSDILKNLAQKWNLSNNPIFVQGSSLRVSNLSDIGDLDIAIKVDATTFGNLVQRFKNAKPTKRAAIEADELKGIIRGVNMNTTIDNRTFTGSFYMDYEQLTGIQFLDKYPSIKNIQISMLLEGGIFDIGPYFNLR